jgi:hypothetical protein
MESPTHPVEKEELMAYLDGELPSERAATVAVHLGQCQECLALAADLRFVSERLTVWRVEPSPERLAEEVTAALPEPTRARTAPADQKPLVTPPAPRPRLVPGWVLGFAGALGVMLILLAVSVPNLLRSRLASNPPVHTAVTANIEAYRDAGQGAESAGGGAGGASYAPQKPTGPMIVRTASLTLLTREFEKTRDAIEALVRQHQGYSAQLTVAGQTGGGRTLTATFRVPADQLDAVLAEMKKLGQVDQESQGGEEVTQQYVDLGARLSNARNTEQRLVDVLRQRTGKVADILAVEQEIARVREEIERMEAQLKNLENQVRFATLQVKLSEEYKAQLEVAPSSTGARLWNALVEGYRGAVESALGLLLVLLAYGPVLLLWALILFWPARFAWRRLRTLAASR